ncbi:BamA/TamA family outer membrane protein [Ferrimonas kyonanensis]|uniref:BamA/TamA family outer membrane protein n=1 Tax=Ferrimonas kyonanensis TaxID=364763 RepID=UPI00041D0679|nr:BamA/TamA family outer membrane protein [Ferrimonas kyonanensis]
MKSAWIGVACLLAAPAVTAAENSEAETGLVQRASLWMDRVLEELGADGAYDPHDGIDWSLLPGPFYTPEKSFGIGISAVGLYQADDVSSNIQPSSITINGFGSVNGAYGVQVRNKSFFDDDRYRLYIEGEFTSSPDIFYGTGIDAGRDESQLTDFERNALGITPQFLMRVAPATYVGVGYELSRAKARDLDGAYESGGGPAFFADTIVSSGVTLHLVHDSRDFVLNASEGHLLQADVAVFSKALGSDQDFEKYSLTYNDYLSLTQLDAVLAWQWLAEFSSGDVPWDQLSHLGGSHRLRGYEEGQYRGKQMTLGQAEWRQHLRGRHGMVVWAGLGTVSDSISQLGDDKWLHSVGVGYRFEVKPRVNVRLDMGFGNGDGGFYFSVNEAF